MRAFRIILLNDIFAMLDACAKGHRRKERDHKWLITYNGRSFPSLPLGKHGARKNPEIFAGHVRKMVNHLRIDKDCATSVLGDFL